jgi:hypothetical protein
MVGAFATPVVQLTTGWYVNFSVFAVNYPTSRLATYIVPVKTTKQVLNYPCYSAVVAIPALSASPSTTAFSPISSPNTCQVTSAPAASTPASPSHTSGPVFRPGAIAGAMVGAFAGTALSPSAWHGFYSEKSPESRRWPGWAGGEHKTVEAVIISAVPLACNINRDDPYFVYPFSLYQTPKEDKLSGFDAG